jgi:hypothetical protein
MTSSTTVAPAQTAGVKPPADVNLAGEFDIEVHGCLLIVEIQTKDSSLDHHRRTDKHNDANSRSHGSTAAATAPPMPEAR